MAKELDIEKLLEQIVEGLTYRQMAEFHGVTLWELHKFLHLEQHSARAKDAMNLCADSYADMATETIKNCSKNNPVEVQIARELASHFRWMASKRRPKAYGDKVDVTTDGDKLPANSGFDLSKLPVEALLALKESQKKA